MNTQQMAIEVRKMRDIDGEPWFVITRILRITEAEARRMYKEGK